ncbi:hypothetical protein ACFWOG_26845 [Kitasatospora sp. NPDC058406]|uniref:hypothetical protein n=1 Tax=Kitasatospora sp. NPDC058406 TaxID=3346483 RepID=UPI003649C56D
MVMPCGGRSRTVRLPPACPVGVPAGGWSFLEQALRAELDGEGGWFDTSEMTVDEVVDAVLAKG